jgi:hypothetical protein
MTDQRASFVAAITAFFSCFFGRAGAWGFPITTVGDVSTFHVGASLVQHDVVADGHAPMGRVSEEGGVLR